MYFKDLNEKEKAHLRSQGITTLAQFKLIASIQKGYRDNCGPRNEPCYECKNIARKLGLPT